MTESSATVDQSTPSTAVAQTPLEYDAFQEVRFAVVIYGGVSLAIYINGIVQEMLRLVRATAPSPDKQKELYVRDPVGSEKVYRKLGCLVGNPDRGPLVIAEEMRNAKAPLPPVHSRFVIDVLSGTSAGGINAVFLAKALANDQSLNSLENVWVTEGDIKTLLNDKSSLSNVDERLSLRTPPPSLLNGERMYLQLLSALDRMDEKSACLKSPFVERLDLFCTATDLSGLRLPLPIADGLIYERRYRNVFQFQHPKRCADGTNDFRPEDNPFLAFAARCTSAFPFAFEPMTLSDIYPVLRTAPVHRDKPYSDPAASAWRRFYPAYSRDSELAFVDRAFGDGGYLDNKPFSYAVDTTLTRHADLPVDRKLVYVEPKPDVLRPASDERPDALQNSLAALTALPREETIREDLARVLRRNSEVERLKRVLKTLHTFEPDWNVPDSTMSNEAWLKRTREQDVEAYGFGYLAYQRLKLSEVTDQLTDLVSETFDISRESSYRAAVRVLLGVWREQKVCSHAEQRQFLLDFDVHYRLRRLRHVAVAIKKLGEVATPQSCGGDAEQLRDYRSKLRDIKRDLGEPHRALRKVVECGCKLNGAGGVPVSAEQLDLVLSPPTDLSKFAGLGPDAQRNDDLGFKVRGAYVLEQCSNSIGKLERALAEALKAVLTDASTQCRASFALTKGASPGVQAACRDVAKIYNGFEAHDAIFFPITFGTDTGEGEPIDIHRISPDDTSARRDIRIQGNKLKGQALGSFGAFLDDTWRLNDILWGRLDGAERLIEIVLPELDEATKALRKELIDEAHGEIVVEFLTRHKLAWLRRQPAALVNDWRALLTEFLETEIRVEPEPQTVVLVAARATNVTGQILEAIFDKPAWARRSFSWLTALGKLAWGLAEVAVPRTLSELLFNYWLQLWCVVAGMAIVAGMLVKTEGNGLLELGVALLAVALAVYFARAALRRYFKRLDAVPNWMLAALGAAVCVLSGFDLWLFREKVPGAAHWESLPHTASGALGSAWSLCGAFCVSSMVVETILGFQLAIKTAAIERVLDVRAPVDATRERDAAPIPGAAKPARALQFARTWRDVASAVGHREHFTRHQVKDVVSSDYLFIGASVSVALALGLTIALSKGPIGFAICVAGIVAGCADSIENTRMLRLIAAPLPAGSLENKLEQAPFGPAIVKWLSVIAALLILLFSLIFL